MRLLTTLFFFSLVLALSHTALGQGFSVSPSRLLFSGNPGETVTESITFSNTSPNTLSFLTGIQDWDRDSLGNKVYYPKNTQPGSNASWLTLSANDLAIQPGETKQVVVFMNIPADAKKLSRSMIFFTQVKEQKPELVKGATSIGVNVLMEVGVQVYYTPRGLNAGEFEFLSFEDRGTVAKENTSVRRLAVKIHNKGAINKDAFVRFELTNKETGQEIKTKPEIIAMLPDATQWVMVDVPANLQGKFLAVALLDAGSAYDLKVAEKEIIYHP